MANGELYELGGLLKFFLIWPGAVNLFAVLLTCIDKGCSRKRGARRVPERVLFAAAFLGGAAGMYAAMRVIRHKTLHRRFMIGLPLIIVLQVFLAGVGAYYVRFM